MTSDSELQILRMSSSSPTRTRAEQIADSIARDISNGVLKPHQKLSEAELALQFQVSRGPIRDALDLLERNMLVTIKPRSYTIVNQLNFRELEQLFEFRKGVLSLASKFSARNRTEKDIDKLKVGLESLLSVLNTKNVNLEVHAIPAANLWDLIIDASHSPVVRQACLHFTGGNIWSRAVADNLSESKLRTYTRRRKKLWQQNLDAISQGDEAAAFEAGANLVENNWFLLKDSIANVFPQ